MRVWFLKVFASFCLSSFSLSMAIMCASAPAQAQTNPCDIVIKVHHDIVLIGLPCPATADVSIVPTLEGVDKIIEALDLIQSKSPGTFNIINQLKNAGPVIVTYDPNPPLLGTVSTLNIASFSPAAYQDMRTDKTPIMFPATISRDGIKWPLADVAAALGHELMGHGKQYLEDRLDNMRTLDLECEAWLLQEQVYQDLEVDKFSREMVAFRQQLEQLQCSDFIRYMRKRKADQVKIWDVQNPDVPLLLSIFEDYIAEQKRLGMIDSAQAASEKNLQEAIDKAEATGDPDELFSIGAVFFLSRVSPQHDPAKAAVWFEKAARQGHPVAQAALAELYAKGEGVQQDISLARRLYKAAAQQGNANATYELGVLYDQGRGVKKDPRVAGQLYVRASRGLDTRVLVAFGILNHKGYGFPQDSARAYDLFLKAARLGNSVGRYTVGLMRYHGDGVPQDRGEAAKWIRYAAGQGHAAAQFMMGTLYEKGHGVKADLAKARTWYGKAQKNGYAEANAKLAQLGG